MRAIVIILLAASTAAPREELRFTRAPSAARSGDRTGISFAISRAADVEVAVLDASGVVIRHLAAGVLGGPKPPPPPLKSGLDQALEWDGRDDFGRATAGGPFRVRVRSGMGARFGNFIGEDPSLFGSIHSLATDEDGNLYAMAWEGGLNQNLDTLRVFSPEGRYLRTLIPLPADLPPDQAGAAAAWDADRKAFRPKNLRSQLPAFYPWESGARLVSASKRGGIVLVSGTNLFRLDLTGGGLRGPQPLWGPKAGLKNPAWNILQFAGDAGALYCSNVAGTKYDTKAPAEIDAAFPQGRVYRIDPSKPGSDPGSFFDLALPDWSLSKHWLPNAWNKRTAAYGIALDARGHLYVCDLVNQEVVEVDPAGRRVSSVKVPWPERVHVNAAGDLYVVSRLAPPKDGHVGKKLLKVTGRGDATRIAAELGLRGKVGEASAMGVAQGRPVLWLAGGAEVLCVRDEGGAFSVLETALRPRPGSQQDWNRICADPGRDEVYTSDGGRGLWRYDGRTGEGELLRANGKPLEGVDVAVGYDGLLYVRTGPSFSGPLERFTRDLKPAPYPGGSHVLSRHIYNRYGVGNSEKGLGVGPRGECYVNFMYGWNKYFIAGFDPDGKPMKGAYLEGKVAAAVDLKSGYPPGLTSAVIGPIPASCGGVRVDLEGNIYLGLRLLPKGFVPPAGFEKDPAYGGWTGSVVKFPPAGGTVLGAVKEDDPPAPGGPRIPSDRGMTLVGALAVYPGLAPLSGGGYGGGGSACVCRAPRFDVDRYGRLAIPNAVTNSVLVTDNAGNLILELGAYGNFDSGRAIRTPEIPLGWPTGACWSGEHLYVNDTLNRRAVRVVRTAALEAACDVR